MTKKLIMGNEESFSGYSLGGSLKDAKEFIDQLITRHGEEAQLCFDPHYCEPYDSEPWPRFTILVSRFETDLEYETRTTQEAGLAVRIEDHERTEYERLKRKFNTTKE